MGKEDFLADIKTQSSVLYQLLVVGEAVKRLSREFRAQHPEIPWSLIAGMRDQLMTASGESSSTRFLLPLCQYPRFLL